MQAIIGFRKCFLCYMSCSRLVLPYPTWLSCEAVVWSVCGLLQMRGRSRKQLLGSVQTGMAAAAGLAIPIWMSSLLACAGCANYVFVAHPSIPARSQLSVKLLYQTAMKSALGHMFLCAFFPPEILNCTVFCYQVLYCASAPLEFKSFLWGWNCLLLSEY